MRLVSLFAGVGGFDLAFERAGFECVGQCEIDPHARAVLDYQWPDVPKHDDVTTLKGLQFGPAEVVTFGSPCQDLSVAGKRAGLDGERSGLFLEAVRFIREMLEETNGAYPKFAVWENVPGAFSSNGGGDFAAVLAHLVGGEVRTPASGWAAAGVAFGPEGSAEWRTLDSQHFGVPQRRRRIFLVFHPGGERAGEVLFEWGGVPGDSPQSRTPGQGITGSLTGGPGSSSAGNPDDNRAQAGFLIPFRKLAFGQYVEDEKASTVAARDGKDATDLIAFNWQDGQNFVASDKATNPLRASQTEAIAFTAKDYGGDAGSVSPTVRCGGVKGGGVMPAVAFALRGREDGAQPELSGDKVNSLRGAGGGSSRDYVAFAAPELADPLTVGANQTTGRNGEVVAQGYAVRRLTPIECERLQGFPDEWTSKGIYDGEIKPVSDTQRYRQMGNAVTVNTVQWIAERIAEVAA